MLFVYRRASSTGARELVNGLMDSGIPAKRWSDRFPRTPTERDKVICWGEATPAGLTAEVLNGAPVISKYEAAVKLREAGVPTVEVSRTVPAMVPSVDPAIRIHHDLSALLEEFLEVNPQRTDVYRTGVQAIVERSLQLQDALGQPVPLTDPGEWLPRKNNHVGGNDLLHPGQADYYAKKESITEEFRIHSFKGKSIRAGKKVPREGFEQTKHPWVRSFDGGWRIHYDGFESTRQQRELAAQAIAVLGLDFGAVDLGVADGRLLVLEVNRAPGLEGGTITAYVNAIQKWLRGEFAAQVAPQRRAA
jgi:hypothetical protein